MCAIWALKSFYHQAGVDYPIVLHVQGTPPARAVAKLRSHFPHARLVLQREADQVVGNQLRARGLRRLEAARRENPFMLKLTDFALTSLAANVMILDSDVLFFRRPRALLDLGDTPVERCLFLRDPASTYNVTEELARAELGILLAPRINTGIVVFPRERFDLARCEAFLEHPQVARRTGLDRADALRPVGQRGRAVRLPARRLPGVIGTRPAVRRLGRPPLRGTQPRALDRGGHAIPGQARLPARRDPVRWPSPGP